MIVTGYKTCGAIRGEIEGMFREAQSQCQPAYDKGSIALVIASQLPLFSIPDAKRAWFIAIVAAVGYETRRAGLRQFSTIYVMDSDSVKTLDTFSMPVARAAELQGEMKSRRIDSSTFVSDIMAEMRATKLPSALLQ